MIPATSSSLRAEMLEQVMRVTADDALVVPFLDAAPRSREAHAALGRLISDAHVRLMLGCPLMAFVSGTHLDPEWRRSYPASPDSLWGSFEFLSTMYGPPSSEDPYSGLEALRSMADEDLRA